MKPLTSLLILVLFAFAVKAQQNAHATANIHKFVVDEVLQTTSYTYLLANENGRQQWLALPRVEAKVGEVYYYQEGIEMKDFKSSELDRTFASVLFISGVQNASTLQPDTPPQEPPAPTTGGQIIAQAEGSITIAELIANKDKYAGKEVVLRGRVVKYNPKIMGKNWLHLQDGSGADGKSDITVTTDMVTKVGEIITIKGTVVLNKDIGSGYFYEIIIENATILTE